MSAPIGTILDALDRTARARGSATAHRVPVDGVWRDIAWHDYAESVEHVALGFLGLGVGPDRNLAILSPNRPEWCVADLAAVWTGALPAGIYANSTPEQAAYVLHHAGARVLVIDRIEGREELLRTCAARGSLETVVVLTGETAPSPIPCLSWPELSSRGAAAAGSDSEARAKLAQRRAALDTAATCSLIYTSGTTGEPKAVMLTHANVLWMCDAVIRLLELGPNTDMLSYLPLSHVAEQMISLYAPLVMGNRIWFAESLERVPEHLREVRPRAFVGVPRVWEKMAEAIEERARKAPAVRRALLHWARGRGLAAGYADQRGDPRPPMSGLADRLVLSRVREALGLDQADVLVSSAAPISRETLEVFLGLGMPILELYGMSECTGPATVCTRERYRTGRAGYPIPGTEVRTAADGEILVRGPHVFAGYYRNPEATAQAVDSRGWLHSGDTGEIDDEGFLTVTGRKKELLVTAGGKNVAPVPIEALLTGIPGVREAVVVGDGRKYLGALLALDPDGLPAAARDEAGVRTYLERAVKEVNGRLARHETIKRFEILPAGFSVDTGELTPTLKLKRHVIRERYADRIAALYD